MEKRNVANGRNKGQKRQDSTTAVESSRFFTSIDIPKETRSGMIALLNQELADVSDLYSQTKQAHWNVKGVHFHQLHVLFDEIAAGLLVYMDELAERVTALGGEAMGTLRMGAAASRLTEYPEDVFDGMEVVAALIERTSRLAKSVREDIEAAEKAEDMGTSDLFIEVSRGLDKWLWFLEAHLQK
jgi:starvation-inducible DNA-binding protein